MLLANNINRSFETNLTDFTYKRNGSGIKEHDLSFYLMNELA